MISKEDAMAAGYTAAEYEAAARYIRRKNRRERPEGHFDRARRFWLSEDLPCCRVRTPSRAHPFSELSHGRTMIHIANLEGANVKAARRLARLLEVAKDINCPAQLQALLSKHRPPKRQTSMTAPLGASGSPQPRAVLAGSAITVASKPPK